MIFSVLHLVLTIRAVLRSVSERFVFGILAGLARAVLMLVGVVFGAAQTAVVMLPHMTLTRTPTEPSPTQSLLLLFGSVVGPLLAFALLWVSYRRGHDVPAAQEEKLRRPFRAWLPVGILDAIYVVIAIFGSLMSEP